jgi:hypothetical protein
MGPILNSILSLGVCLVMAGCASTPTQGVTSLKDMDTVIHQLIPLGTDEATAVQTLKNEGFSYLNSEKEDAAADAKDQLPPNTKVSVFARNDNGSLIPTWIIGLRSVDGKIDNIRVMKAGPAH